MLFLCSRTCGFRFQIRKHQHGVVVVCMPPYIELTTANMCKSTTNNYISTRKIDDGLLYVVNSNIYGIGKR